jgi:methylglutaconyl-CoA hydratase
MPLVLVERSDSGVVSITLNRPERRNALSPDLVAELTRAFATVAGEASARIVVLRGSGEAFCAGGDIDSMREKANLSEAATSADAASFIELFRTVAACPLPVVARVQGAALGGGTALAACADVVVAGRGATFGCTEVRVGIVPAVVAPHVIARIGFSAARRIMLSGERFGAERALQLGLVDSVCDEPELDGVVTSTTLELLRGHRHAQTALKALLQQLQTSPASEADTHTLAATVRARMSPDGQRAMAQFMASLARRDVRSEASQEPEK